MSRYFCVYLFLLGCASVLVAQQTSRGSYEGTSAPPPDNTITTDEQAAPQSRTVLKPAASQVVQDNDAADDPAGVASKPTSVDPSLNYPPPEQGDGTDDGIVLVVPEEVHETPAQPMAKAAAPRRTVVPAQEIVIEPETEQTAEADPDGDIVNAAPVPPGTLAAGTIISARLKQLLSSSLNKEGDSFDATVVRAVRQGNNVLIPAGSEIRGTVRSVSTGDWGGHGSMILRPQTLILSNGSRYKLSSVVSNAPESKARVSTEGKVTPGSRLKKDGVEYGGGIATGVVAGGLLGGPAGAVAGSLVGAGVVTVHLLKSHPQANLEPGTLLEFNLTKSLRITAESAADAGGPAPDLRVGIIQ